MPTGPDAINIISEIAFDVAIVPFDRMLIDAMRSVVPGVKFIVLSEGNAAALGVAEFDGFMQKPCTMHL